MRTTLLCGLAGTATLLQMLCCHSAAFVDVQTGMPSGKSLGDHRCIHDKVRCIPLGIFTTVVHFGCATCYTDTGAHVNIGLRVAFVGRL